MGSKKKVNEKTESGQKSKEELLNDKVEAAANAAVKALEDLGFKSIIIYSNEKYWSMENSDDLSVSGAIGLIECTKAKLLKGASGIFGGLFG